MATDLHIHSIYSDGTLTPAQIAEEALRLGITAIAIADHDTIDGVAEALRAAEGRGLEVVPAVEINVEERGEEIHILGYFLDLNSPQLVEQMERLRQSRANRIGRFVAKLAEAGVDLSLEEVLEGAGPGTVGRPHLAQALVARGYTGDEKEAFRRYLSSGAPTYVPRQHISAREAIEIIRGAGGLPALAHPTKINPPKLVEEMICLGVVGLEVYHPENTPVEEAQLLAYAQKQGLLVSGGSDYHGRSTTRDFSLGQKTCPYEHYLRLKTAAGDLRVRASRSR